MNRPCLIARSRLVVGAAVLIASSTTNVQAQLPARAPAAGPVRPAAIPEFQEARLPNGLRLLLVESHRQPVVSLSLMLPAGAAYDPAGKEGVSQLVASTLTKGAGSRSAEDVSSAIEGVGGILNATSGPDFLEVRASVLADNAAIAFELTSDAIARPSFATKEVELVRTQALSALQLDQSSPAALAQRLFSAQLYGAHPYGKRPSSSTIRAITGADLREFQQGRLRPNGALLVVAGDISLARVRDLAQRHFGSWSGAAPSSIVRPTPAARAATEIVLVHRPGSVQSNILVGNVTFGPANPNYYALSVSSQILGGGSEGRLFKTLREQRSWTYGAYSNLSRAQDDGAFMASAEVRNAVTDSALVELLKIERSLGATPIPAAELDAAKSALVGRLPLLLETAQGIAEQVGRYTMLGLPKDYIRTLRPRLASVTAAQVATASRDYIRPDRALVVVVGDGTQIYDKLAKIASTRIVSSQGDAMQPSDLVQRSTVLPVDLTKLVERADSFTVMVQGNPLGYQTSTLNKTATGYTYRTAVQIGPVIQQTTEAKFAADLAPQSVKGSGQIQGVAIGTDLTYGGGRVRGSSKTPTATGIKSIVIDTTVAAGTLDDNMIGALVPGLSWAPNAKFTFNAFDASTGASRQLTLAVTATESVTVPAGTFPVYRVDFIGQQQPVTLYITTAPPYRVVKLVPSGAPLEFLLVK